MRARHSLAAAGLFLLMSTQFAAAEDPAMGFFITSVGSVQDLSHIGFGGLFHQATLSRCLSRSMFM